MTLRGEAFLAMWHDIAAEGETEYNDWHTREHMPERVGVAGFLVGRRYVDWSLQAYRYFTLYEGQTLQTFNSPPYLERLNAPTAWTQRMQPHFRNMIRGACSTVVSTGRGVGGALLTARLYFVDGGLAEFVAAARDLAHDLENRHGVTGVHIGVADPSVTSVRTAEAELRKADSAYDAIVLVEGIGRRELLAVQASSVGLLTADVGIDRAEVAVYDLAYRLTSEHLA